MEKSRISFEPLKDEEIATQEKELIDKIVAYGIDAINELDSITIREACEALCNAHVQLLFCVISSTAKERTEEEKVKYVLEVIEQNAIVLRRFYDEKVCKVSTSEMGQG